MNKMDELKLSLLALQPGEVAEILQVDTIEAIESDRRYVDEYPGPQMRFGEWCQDNHLFYSIMAASDYIIFEKRNA